MRKLIPFYLLLTIYSNALAQSYSECIIFKNLIDTTLLRNIDSDFFKFPQGDTVFFNEVSLKQLKEEPKVFYTPEFLRDANSQEIKEFEKWKKNNAPKNVPQESIRFILDANNKTFIQNGKIYSLIRGENPYPDWFITNGCDPKILNYITKGLNGSTDYVKELKYGYDWKEKELKTELINANYKIEDIDAAMDRIKLFKIIGKTIDEALNPFGLDGTILTKAAYPINPETLLNKPLVFLGTRLVTPIHFEFFFFKNIEDNRIVIFHPYNDIVWHYPDYTKHPILVSKRKFNLLEKRKQFAQQIDTSETIKSQEFVYDIFNYNGASFKLKSVSFDEEKLMLHLDSYHYDKAEEKIIKTETTVQYDTTMTFYDYTCATTVHNKIVLQKVFHKFKEEEERKKYLKQTYTATEVDYILQGKIFIGMSEKAMIESLGYPVGGVNETVTARSNFKQFVYDIGRYVYVENGKVVAWQKFDF